VGNATKAVYQKPDPRFKEQPNISRESPAQGSKAEPATCQNPRPGANRYFRIRRNFLPGVNQRSRACALPCPLTCRGRGGGWDPPDRAPSPRAPGDGTESPITFNMLLTFRPCPPPYWDRGRPARSFFAELKSGRDARGPSRVGQDKPGDDAVRTVPVHLSSLTLLSASFGSTSLKTPMKSRSANARARSQSIGTGLDGSDRRK